MNDAKMLVDAINEEPTEAGAYAALADALIEQGRPGANIVLQAGRHAEQAAREEPDLFPGFHHWSLMSRQPAGWTHAIGSTAGREFFHAYDSVPFGPVTVHVRRPPERVGTNGNLAGPRPYSPVGAAHWDQHFNRTHPKVVASVHVKGTRGDRIFHAEAHPENVEHLAADLPPLAAAHLRRAVAEAHANTDAPQPARLARVNLTPKGNERETSVKKGVLKPDKLNVLPEVFGVTHYPTDGILHQSILPGTGNVDRTGAPAAWYERSAVHKVLDEASPHAPFAERDVVPHVALIKKLLAEKPELLGVAGESYKREAENLHHIVSAHADGTLKSSNVGSRPTSPVLEQLAHAVRPLVGVANRLLVRAGQARDMHAAPAKPAAPAVAPPEKDPADPLTAAAEARAAKHASDADAFSVKPVAGGSAKKVVRDEAAKEATDSATLSLADEPDSVSLAPNARWSLIHSMVRDGKDKKQIVDALVKAHGVTPRQASDTIRRFAASHKARAGLEAEPRPGQPAFRLSRPVGSADHDALVEAADTTPDTAAHNPDRNVLAPLADHLYEHGHENAPLVHAAAERPADPKRFDGPGLARGSTVWAHEKRGPHILHPNQSVRDAGVLVAPEEGSTDNYEVYPRATGNGDSHWSSHTYTPMAHGNGQFSVLLVHRKDEPIISRLNLPDTYRKGVQIDVPVHDHADLDRLTAGLHPNVRGYLKHWFARNGMPAGEAGPTRLARKIQPAIGPGTDQRFGPKDLLKQGDPGTLWQDRSGPAPKLVMSDVPEAMRGTSLGYHLNSLYHEHLGKNDKIAGLARQALTNERPGGVNSRKGVFALLGDALRKAKHKAADLYDWASKDQTLGEDAGIEHHVKAIVGRPAGFSDSQWWEKVRRQFTNRETHPQAAQFWRALAARVGADKSLKRIADPAQFKSLVSDAITRIADRHLDRDYLAAVAKTKGKERAETEGAHDLNWRAVIGRAPTGVHRLSRPISGDSTLRQLHAQLRVTPDDLTLRKALADALDERNHDPKLAAHLREHEGALYADAKGELMLPGTKTITAEAWPSTAHATEWVAQPTPDGERMEWKYVRKHGSNADHTYEAHAQRIAQRIGATFTPLKYGQSMRYSHRVAATRMRGTPES